MRIQLGGRMLTRQVEAGTGDGNQNNLALHFGLGTWPWPDSLVIQWPDGTRQRVSNLPVDRYETVEYTPPD